MKRLICYIAIVLFTSACSVAQPSNWILYNAETKPSLVFEEKSDELALFFSSNFEKLTGYAPQLKQNKSNKELPSIVFKRDKNLTFLAFRIQQKANSLIFFSNSDEGWRRAIAYFFIYELKKYPLERISTEKLQNIKLPSGFIKTVQAPTFDYRAPYFKETYVNGFKDFHFVDGIENAWGIWGHNIPKAIKVTKEMLATVKGEINEDQLCFSSSELEKELIRFIKANKIENPEQNKFMIMPQDNNMVCTCEQCKRLGNTNSDASPAVFTLVNKLAKTFPEFKFFSTAYISTRNPPRFKLENNTGVMLSTMDYPKGIVLANSPVRHRVLSDIQKWRRITNDIYLWEYAIHFDIYFSTYPTVLITQQNLQWYANNGITGVFLHGTEEMFAAFSPLKAFVYSQLLQDPFLDVYDLMNTYLKETYPTTANVILEYYMECEDKAFKSNRPLDFYGGWNQDKRKYLDEESLWRLVMKLEEQSMKASKEEQMMLSPIFTALYYQQLELSRVNGINDFGYLEASDKPNYWKVKDEVLDILVKWKKHVKLNEVKHLNESLLSAADYERNWRKLIIGQPYENELAGKKLNVYSELDEQYSDPSVLTDGALGFYDYFNNWMIFSGEQLEIGFNHENKKDGNYELSISFLHQPRHRIHLPQKIIVEINGKEFKFDVDKSKENESLARHEETIKLNVPSSAVVKVKLVKQKAFKRLSIAVDEVKWNKLN